MKKKILISSRTLSQKKNNICVFLKKLEKIGGW